MDKLSQRFDRYDQRHGEIRATIFVLNAHKLKRSVSFSCSDLNDRLYRCLSGMPRVSKYDISYWLTSYTWDWDTNGEEWVH